MAQNRDVQRVFVNTRVRLVVACKGKVILISRSTAGFVNDSASGILFVCLLFSRLRKKEQNMLLFLEAAFHLSFFGEVAHTAFKIAVFFFLPKE